MKKIGIVSILSFVFLFISSLVAYFLGGITFSSVWVPLCVGVGILIASGVLAIFAKRNMALNAVCYVVSGVALGFCIRAWYVFRDFYNPLWLLALVSLACVAYLWVVFVVSRIPVCKSHPKIYALVAFILSFVGYVLLVIFTKTTFISTFGYYMIIEIAFLFAMFNSSDDFYELFRNITISTYSVFVVAVILVISIASGEDFDLDFALDGFDVATPPNKKQTKSR